MQQLSDEENTHLETYKVVLQLLNNEVALNWQRLNNSLIANSILIGAWAVILTQNSDKLQKGLLIGISLLGLILSIFWISATATGNAYHGYWLLWLNFLENKLCPDSEKGRPLVHKIFEKMNIFKNKKPVKIDSQDGSANSQCRFCHKLLTPHIDYKHYKQYTIQMPHIPAIRVTNYFAYMAVLFFVIYLFLLGWSTYIIFFPLDKVGKAKDLVGSESKLNLEDWVRKIKYSRD